MKKSLSSLLITGLGLALLVYSGARSLDFISSTLPPDKQVLAWFALAATEGGLVLWLLYFLYAARGGMQRAIGLVMLVVDFLGSVALFTGDTLLRAGDTGLITALDTNSVRSIILAMSMIIAANVGAVILSHVMDPDNRQSMAIEEARSSVEDAALRMVSENSARLAADTAPQLASSILESVRGEFSGAMSKRQLAARTNPAFSKNLDMPTLAEMVGNPNLDNDHKEVRK